MRVNACGAWLALSMLSVSGCASSPAPRVSTLAEVVAPAAVRPELAAPLTALLRTRPSELLLPFGDEVVRCEVDVTPGRVRATCEGQTEEAADVRALAHDLHTGRLMRRIQQARITSPTVLTERTGLTLRPLPSLTDAGTVYDLGGPIGQVRFEVGERGEVVRGRFEGLDGEEVIETGTLLALGQKLRERQISLFGDRLERRLRGRLEQLLATRKTGVDGRWELRGIRAGDLLQGAPWLPRAWLGVSEDRIRQRWKTRWQSWRLRAVHGEADGESVIEGGGVEAFDGVVRQVEILHGSRPHALSPAPLECSRQDAWLARAGPAFERLSEPIAPDCHWRWHEGEQRLDLRQSAGTSYLTMTWQPGSYDELQREADRWQEQLAAEELRRQHDEVCRRCTRYRGGERTGDGALVMSVDRRTCTMTIREGSSVVERVECR